MQVLKLLTPSELKRIQGYKISNLPKFEDKNTELLIKWIALTGKVTDASDIGIDKSFKFTEKGNIIFSGSKNEEKSGRYFNEQIFIDNEGFNLNEIFGLINGFDNKTVAILKGKEIAKGFKTSSSLVRSCMTDEDVSFYEKNKNVSLLVVKNKTKIYSRALLWNTNRKKILMDRAYGLCCPYIVLLYMIAALRYPLAGNTTAQIKLNWIPAIPVLVGKTKLTVVKELPYLDTFTAISTKKMLLSNLCGNGFQDYEDATSLDFDEVEEAIEDYKSKN